MLRRQASIAGSAGLIPGQGAKIPCATQHGPKNKNIKVIKFLKSEQNKIKMWNNLDKAKDFDSLLIFSVPK